jgi:hypothetical protein
VSCRPAASRQRICSRNAIPAQLCAAAANPVPVAHAVSVRRAAAGSPAGMAGAATSISNADA